MSDHSGAYISSVHPCPDCSSPVANIARVCHNCGVVQPHVDYKGYERIVDRSVASDDAPPAGGKGKQVLRKLSLGTALKAMFTTNAAPRG